MSAFEVVVNDKDVQATLTRLLTRTGDLSEPMADVARILANITEDAFLDETSPFGAPWAPLAPATLRQAARKGRTSPRILQDTGQLAASIASESGQDYAELSVGKVYGAIHQFGGQAGRGHKVTIPARPFMPVDDQGNLSESAQDSILDVLSDYLIE